VCDDCPDPQLCLDTNTCALLDEMTRIAQDSGQYNEGCLSESLTRGQNGSETDDLYFYD